MMAKYIHSDEAMLKIILLIAENMQAFGGNYGPRFDIIQHYCSTIFEDRSQLSL